LKNISIVKTLKKNIEKNVKHC